MVFVSSTLILSYIGGMILYILLELPVSVIQKQFIQRKSVGKRDNIIEGKVSGGRFDLPFYFQILLLPITPLSWCIILKGCGMEIEMG